MGGRLQGRRNGWNMRKSLNLNTFTSCFCFNLKIFTIGFWPSICIVYNSGPLHKIEDITVQYLYSPTCYCQ